MTNDNRSTTTNANRINDFRLWEGSFRGIDYEIAVDSERADTDPLFCANFYHSEDQELVYDMSIQYQYTLKAAHVACIAEIDDFLGFSISKDGF